MFFHNTLTSLKQPERWMFTTWFKFLTRYRRTAIGPLWIFAAPIMFIAFLGALFVGLSNFSTSEFIPHLTVGFISWTLIGGYLMRSHDVFQRNRSYLMQGDTLHTDIILFDNAELFIHFLHQTAIAIAICWYYKTLTSPYAFVSLVGIFLTVINGYWITFVFGTIGARYKDFGEFIGSITSIAFLATPIIWMPARDDSVVVGGRAGVLEAYMLYNPFYHFLELIRAPLLGNPIDKISWMVVGGLTIIGMCLSAYFYKRYRHMLAVWV